MLQSDLQDLLERLQRAGLPLPPHLPDAQPAMQQAAEALGRGNAQQALDAEAEVLDHLFRAGQLLRTMMQDMAGQNMMINNGMDRMRRDPLGRPAGNIPSAIDMPDAEDLDRAWRTLQELQRRAADPGRPEPELQYLDRLLERF